jgi:hypothetical protein
MDYDAEINSLTGETLAIQFVLPNVLHEISKSDSKLRDAIKLGFDNAASDAEDFAFRSASPDHAVKAIGIVEELRTAALGNQDKPRHGV